MLAGREHSYKQDAAVCSWCRRLIYSKQSCTSFDFSYEAGTMLQAHQGCPGLSTVE